MESGDGQNSGGKGGYGTITYYLTQGQTLYVYCGGRGGDAIRATEGGGAAGWNGGGHGGNGYSSTSTGGGGGGGATHVAISAVGAITSENSLFTGTAASPTARSGLVLVAAGGGGGAYNSSVAGAGGGNSYNLGKRASDGSADGTYLDGSALEFVGSQGGQAKTGSNGDNARGGSGGHGGGFKAVDKLKSQYQTYAGSGGSSWGDVTNGLYYTTTSGGATDGGDGKVVVTALLPPSQGANDYTQGGVRNW